MALVVNTNVASITSQMYVNKTNQSMADTMERLSSGKRINSASDDAAGLAISDRLTAQVRGMNQAIRNAQDGQNLIDTTEGAHQEITNILQRMRELAVQSVNDTNSSTDRVALQSELDQLRQEIDRISDSTTWGGQKLLNGGFLNKSLQIGADAGHTVSITVDDASSAALGRYTIDTVANVNATSATAVTDAASDMTATDFDVIGYKGAAEATFAAGSSAKTVAAAVNADTSSTGVTATAVTKAKIALDAVPTGAVTFTLSGGSSAAISATVVNNTDLTNLKDAINAVAGTTGVTAAFDGTSKAALVLTDADGDNITIENFSTTATGVDLEVTALNYDGSAAVGSTIDVASAATGLNDAIVTGAVRMVSTERFSVVDQEAAGDNDLSTAAGYLGNGNGSASSSLSAVSAIDVGTQSGAISAISTLDTALGMVAASRAKLGALSNRLDASVANMANVSANVEASRSQIEDADFAAESANLAKQQIMLQAGTAMLAQANASQQNVLSLLG
jgi:flagellin